jgi:hypothetical protein
LSKVVAHGTLFHHSDYDREYHVLTLSIATIDLIILLEDAESS